MLISVGVRDSLSTFGLTEILNFEELEKAITSHNWSPAVYRNNHRKKENFVSASIVGLDIDGGLTLEKALELFKDFKHIIATTKSHQKEKNGLIADRFRVVLFLEGLCDNAARYEATLNALISQWNFLDPQCKDCARFFYPSLEVVSINKGGSMVALRELPPAEVPPLKPSLLPELTDDQKGRLARSTLEFLVNGAEPGFWNGSLFKAAKDFQEQGYSYDEFYDRAERITGHLDAKDLITIGSAFKSEPKYEPRISQPLLSQPEIEALLGQSQAEARELSIKPSELVSQTLNYLQNKDLVIGQPTYLEGLDDLLGGGKRLGEVTALCAEGKTGKNAIWHYLMHLWIEKKIPFGYASRELTAATEVIPDWLSMHFSLNSRLCEDTQTLGFSDYVKSIDGTAFFAKGRGYFPVQELSNWVEQLKNQGVSYFFFDHLHWCLDDPEDYKAASLLSRTLKDIAVKFNVHIDVIIQPKVLMDGQKPSLNSMKGGSALGQNIDNFITLERTGDSKENLSKLTLKAKRSRLAKLGHIVLHYDETTLKLSEMVPVETSGQAEGFDSEAFDLKLSARF